MSLPAALARNLRLPAIAAPMFLVSGPALVIAACKAGVIGAFPSLNARPAATFERWLDEIEQALGNAARAATPARPVAPYGVNLIVHRSNRRLDSDLALTVAHRAPLVISSVGHPGPVVEAVHGYGGLVLADVIHLHHARKAIQAGVDGLILVCAGAGGHAGTLSPFAFVRQVREFFSGPLVLAGAISDGAGIAAAQALGADLAYLGTRFIACEESLAPAGYKAMIVQSEARDIIYTPAISGIHANFMRHSLIAAGLDPEHLPPPGAHDFGAELDGETKAWRDIWSAGQGVGGIHDVPSVASLVDRLEREWRACVADLAGAGTARRDHANSRIAR